MLETVSTVDAAVGWTGCRAAHHACGIHQPDTLIVTIAGAEKHSLWFQHGLCTSGCCTVQSMRGLCADCRPRNTWFSPRSSTEMTDTQPRRDGSLSIASKMGLLVFARASSLPCSTCIYPSQSSSRPEGPVIMVFIVRVKCAVRACIRPHQEGETSHCDHHVCTRYCFLCPYQVASTP